MDKNEEKGGWIRQEKNWIKLEREKKGGLEMEKEERVHESWKKKRWIRVERRKS